MVRSSLLRKLNLVTRPNQNSNRATLYNFSVQCSGRQVDVRVLCAVRWAGELTMHDLKYPKAIQQKELTSITASIY
jgi:hypothetical protein